MKCPACKEVSLLMADKSWIEVDYCPECRGIWLDRWELEKLTAAEKDFNRNRRDSREEYDDEDTSHRNDPSSRNGGRRRNEWFLERFDFFD